MTCLFEACGDASPQRRHRPGLVRTSTGWHAPAEVFSGRALFGRRRPFVTASSAAGALWRTLRIDAPNVEACISVLEEIARDSSGAERASGFGRHLPLHQQPAQRRSATAGRPPEAPAMDRNEVGDKATDLRARRSGACATLWRRRLRSAIWQAPAALGPLESFMQGARITKVNESTIAFTAATRRRALAHAYLQERFQLATLHLRAALAEEDEVAHDALAVDWDEFHEAAVQTCPAARSRATAWRGRSRSGSTRRAQLDMSSLTLYVTEEIDLADENAVGYAVATAFAGVDQRNVALRWTAAWRRAERGEEPDVMRLAPRQQEDIRHLLEQMEASAKTAKAPLKPRTKPRSKPEEREPDAPKLKSPEDLAHGVEVSIVEPDPSGGVHQEARTSERQAAPAGQKQSFEPRSAEAKERRLGSRGHRDRSRAASALADRRERDGGRQPSPRARRRRTARRRVHRGEAQPPRLADVDQPRCQRVRASADRARQVRARHRLRPRHGPADQGPLLRGPAWQCCRSCRRPRSRSAGSSQRRRSR